MTTTHWTGSAGDHDIENAANWDNGKPNAAVDAVIAGSDTLLACRSGGLLSTKTLDMSGFTGSVGDPDMSTLFGVSTHGDTVLSAAMTSVGRGMQIQWSDVGTLTTNGFHLVSGMYLFATLTLGDDVEINGTFQATSQAIAFGTHKIIVHPLNGVYPAPNFTGGTCTFSAGAALRFVFSEAIDPDNAQTMTPPSGSLPPLEFDYQASAGAIKFVALGTVITTSLTITGTGLGIFGHPGLPQTINVTGPTATASQVVIDKTTLSGTALTAQNCTDGGSNVNVNFGSLSAPTIGSVAPSGGTTAGGTSVTITGTDFAAGATVTIGGVSATDVVVVGPTSITCTTPAHAAGAVNVVVTNTDTGTGTGTNAFTYAVPAPTVTSVAPSSGPAVGGTSVTITGTGFLGVTGVTFNGAPATSVVTVNSTTVTCVAPANSAGVVNVVVTNGDAQTGTGVAVFTYVAAPHVTSVTPAAGIPDGGTPISIVGTGFSGSTVMIGGVPATSVVVVSPTHITCVTPAHALGSVSLVVTNADTQTGTSSFAYTNVLPEACQLNTVTLKNNSIAPALFVDGALVQPGATHVINFVGLSCARQDKLRTACENVAAGSIFTIHEFDSGE